MSEHYIERKSLPGVWNYDDYPRDSALRLKMSYGFAALTLQDVRIGLGELSQLILSFCTAGTMVNM